MTEWLLAAAIALLPVLCFLGALVWLDSYKLVRPGLVLATIAAGAVAAVASYFNPVELIDRNSSRKGLEDLGDELVAGVVAGALVRGERDLPPARRGLERRRQLGGAGRVLGDHLPAAERLRRYAIHTGSHRPAGPRRSRR